MWVLDSCLRQQAECALGITCLQPFFGLNDSAVRGARQVPIEEGPDLGLRQRPGKFVDRLPVSEKLDRRDAADTELGRDRLLFLGVDLGQDEAPLVFVDQFRQ